MRHIRADLATSSWDQRVYAQLYGGAPQHVCTASDIPGPQLIEICNPSEGCNAFITRCSCGYTYDIKKVKDWHKKTYGGYLPRRKGDCTWCKGSTCSGCNDSRRAQYGEGHDLWRVKNPDGSLTATAHLKRCPGHRGGTTGKEQSKKRYRESRQQGIISDLTEMARRG